MENSKGTSDQLRNVAPHPTGDVMIFKFFLYIKLWLFSSVHLNLLRRSNMSRSFLTPDQISWLESTFKGFPDPNEQQEKEISEHIGAEPREIRFWFLNKRTQPERQYERAVYRSLFSENERMKAEILALRERLRRHFWYTRGGESITLNQIQSYIEKMDLENIKLKKERERLVTQVSLLTKKPLSKENLWAPNVEGDSGVGMRDSTFHKGDVTRNSSSAASQPEFIPDADKSTMMQIALASAEDLVKFLLTNEPMWIYDSGKYRLNRDCYEDFIKKYHIKQNVSGKLEASKASCEVSIDATVLVNMLLDSSNRLDLFPTLVTKAETLQVVETGNGSGYLHLMHEIMHTLSPLVAPREFYLIRFCTQVDVEKWVFVDISHGALRGNDGNLVPYCRKLLSGCMIQDMHNGHSKVSWLEFVEVDDRTVAGTHSLYSDLVNSGLIYGSERWISTIKNKCERVVKNNERPAEGSLLSVEGKRSLLDLSHCMVKEFCASLKMPINELSETGDQEVRVLSRKCTDPRNPGIVFCGTTSLWLPFSPKHVFSFFKDKRWRHKWDFLALGKPVTEIAGAASGCGRANGVSVFKPVSAYQSNILILQETFSDLLGYYVVLAPVDLMTINKSIAGLNTSDTPILPSGFVITCDGRGRASPINLNNSSSIGDSGSLLTVVFQTLFNHHPAHFTEKKHLELMKGMKDLVSTTVKNIKAALIPSSSDTKSHPPSTV